MERKVSLSRAKQILGTNFIGPDELSAISDQLGISLEDVKNIPDIPFKESYLSSNNDSAILILTVPLYKDNSPLTILKLREHFGWNPGDNEPCFYNQDWYINESFVKVAPSIISWNLVSKIILPSSRKKSPESIVSLIPENQQFPSAFLLTYVFFAYYLHSSGSVLWPDDYLWCSDSDHNGDRIYVGRYFDRAGINKNGFSVHRHLSIKECYGFAGQIVET